MKNKTKVSKIFTCSYVSLKNSSLIFISIYSKEFFNTTLNVNILEMLLINNSHLHFLLQADQFFKKTMVEHITQSYVLLIFQCYNGN